MFRRKGAKTLKDWQSALEGELTEEKREYILRGKAVKTEYSTLLKLIDGCVIDNLNAALAPFKDGVSDREESLYLLARLEDTLRKISFFEELGFLKKSDKSEIRARVLAAAESFLKGAEAAVTDDADISYSLAAVERLARGQTLRT